MQYIKVVTENDNEYKEKKDSNLFHQCMFAIFDYSSRMQASLGEFVWLVSLQNLWLLLAKRFPLSNTGGIGNDVWYVGLLLQTLE